MKTSHFAATLLAGCALGIAVGISIRAAEAHPCNDGGYKYEPPQQCRYVQVINPYTGKLETEYVCD